MFKKTLTALAIAGAIAFTGASAANADTYPPDGTTIIINNPTIIIGGTTNITINGVGDYATIIFNINTTTGGTLSSVALANTASASITKPVVDGSASTLFTAKAAGTYTVTAAAPDGTVLGSTSVTVNTAAAGGSGSLPATGGEVPTIAIWGGVGAVALGGLAVAAVAARRRAASSN